MKDTDKRKLLSGLSHAALILNVAVLPVLVPLIILLVTNDTIVRGNAKEAINFAINIFICGVISLLLIFVEGIGIFLLYILALISFFMPLIATIYAVKNIHKPYRYPLIWHFL
ncbi:DUF4870 domain-containing protein [Gloeocapsopsis dulcis]|uniref:DUF4870 domain-containing protein n=1 Tax=Gloeocapsopsis dulcis AAB1 = 1H9 TaxID=1433147 RepID=A0A6N8FSV0_9CHRO|nr:DUF4870 domain-containing protein [Gloeocapsopsis dulcis]MUL35267.1 hypothetical protein [Gloeocapsopsis dulcis AAB1 = 1H9]WNN89149.1 DUF4870 domain-containing protein [Gloeocapsopsis dulcis]